MKILAVGDIHYPRYAQEFKEALSTLERPDLFLLAGDMINRGAAEEFPNVLDIIESYLGKGFPIVGCFGNEEYSEVRKKILSLVRKRIDILDEQSKIYKINGLKIGIIGTQGSLDKPTNWQRENIPNIKKAFERRADRASNLLRKIRKKADRRILLMHYSPCLETCEGKDLRSFAWLGSKKFYAVVASEQPDLVIHGHVHNSDVHAAMIGSTKVRNVAFPAVGKITELDLWT
ncbi:metallophosphoesterase [Candidatus Thorarchaeota archaeon]|nr:MAG: metallophosphoesterase [Candidatus Thorarchaeota archaeon]